MLYKISDVRDYGLEDRFKSNYDLEKPYLCAGCQWLRSDLYPKPINWTVGRPPRYSLSMSGFQLGIWVVRDDLLDVLRSYSDRVIGGAVSVDERGLVRGYSTVYCSSLQTVRLRGDPHPKRGKGAFGFCQQCKRSWSNWACLLEPLYVLGQEINGGEQVLGNGDMGIFVSTEVRAKIINAGITDVGFTAVEVRKSAHAPVPEWGES